MRTIYTNGKKVKITAETLRRIGKIAEERKINLSEAISFCLQKVICLTPIAGQRPGAGWCVLPCAGGAPRAIQRLSENTQRKDTTK